MAVLNPVTHKEYAILELSIPAALVLEKYQQEHVDVSRFFEGVPEVHVYRCPDTGYRFYYPFTIFGDGAFYADLGKNMQGYYVAGRWEHDKALSLIQHGLHVLEVGCGSGYFLDQLRNKGVQAEGLELNPEALQEVRDKGLVVHGELLESFSERNPAKYDVVCSFQVLEHIWDVRSYIEHALKVLKPGGRLIIGVPNNNPFIFRYDVYHTLNLPPHHAGLWNKEAFSRLPDFFAMQTVNIFIEPLQEISTWYRVQKENLRQQTALFSNILRWVPRPIVKGGIRIFRHQIEGRNVLAVFQKP